MLDSIKEIDMYEYMSAKLDVLEGLYKSLMMLSEYVFDEGTGSAEE